MISINKTLKGKKSERREFIYHTLHTHISAPPILEIALSSYASNEHLGLVFSLCEY